MNHVIFQKGHGANKLEGNQRFNDLIRSHWFWYDAGEALDTICDSIFEKFNGRYFQKEQGTKKLVELTKKKQLKEKIRQSLRYALNTSIVFLEYYLYIHPTSLFLLICRQEHENTHSYIKK